MAHHHSSLWRGAQAARRRDPGGQGSYVTGLVLAAIYFWPLTLAIIMIGGTVFMFAMLYELIRNPKDNADPAVLGAFALLLGPALVIEFYGLWFGLLALVVEGYAIKGVLALVDWYDRRQPRRQPEWQTRMLAEASASASERDRLRTERAEKVLREFHN